MSNLYSEGSEQALIAKLLLDPAQIPLIAGAVSPEDFYISDYREAFRVMLRLTEERKSVDIVALQASGLDVDVMDLTPGHHAPLEQYAATIRTTAFRRKVLAAADRVGRAAESGAEDLMSTVQEAFSAVARGDEAGSLSTPGDAVDDYLGTLSARMAGEVPALTYGVPGMDNILLPAQPGELIIMAARPSVGKSAMAENVADHWASLGRGPVVFVSLEMKKSAILDRTLSRKTGISAEKIIRGTLDEGELEAVRGAAGALRSRPILFLDNAFATTSDVRTAAAKAKVLHDGKLAGIVVDYLQILKDMPGSDLRHKVTFISGMLKAIAVENDCPVLALSQLSRSSASERRDPELTDLRESGSIEQDADTVIAMSRGLDDPIMRIFVLKQRQGRVGQFRVKFDGNHSVFTEPPMVTLGDMVATTAPAPDPTPAEEMLSWG